MRRVLTTVVLCTVIALTSACRSDEPSASATSGSVSATTSSKQKTATTDAAQAEATGDACPDEPTASPNRYLTLADIKNVTGKPVKLFNCQVANTITVRVYTVEGQSPIGVNVSYGAAAVSEWGRIQKNFHGDNITRVQPANDIYPGALYTTGFNLSMCSACTHADVSRAVQLDITINGSATVADDQLIRSLAKVAIKRF